MIHKQDTQNGVTDREIFTFAKYILAVLAVVFIGAFIVNATLDDEVSAAFWDKVSTIVPPLVTLIIGRYFTKK